jgi:hypothetical protein
MRELLFVLEVLVACAGGILLLFLFVYAIGRGLRAAEPHLERGRQEALRYPPEGNFFWPHFASLESARVYCRAASVVPFLFSLLYFLAGWYHLFGYGPWVWLFSAVFLPAGIAMRRGSRVASVLALVSYAALAGFQLSRGSFPNPTLLIFGGLALVHAVRAAAVLHRSGRSTAAA